MHERAHYYSATATTTHDPCQSRWDSLQGHAQPAHTENCTQPAHAVVWHTLVACASARGPDCTPPANSRPLARYSRDHSHLQTKDAASCDATASAHMLLALPADSLRVHACSLVITWTARRHSEATRSDTAAVAAFAPVTARESQTVRRAEQPRAQCIMVMHDSSVHAGNKPPAYLKFLSMHSSQLQLHQHLLLERLRSTTSAQ